MCWMFVNWCETRYDIKYIEWVSHFHNTDVMSTSYRNTTTTTTKIEFPSKFSDWSEQHQQLNLKIIINSFKNSKIKFLRRFFFECLLSVRFLSVPFFPSIQNVAHFSHFFGFAHAVNVDISCYLRSRAVHRKSFAKISRTKVSQNRVRLWDWSV